MMKLSIIIPVYNVEKYIGKCLDSCLEQDLLKDEYEIIVVNDGSPDNSSAIVEEYIQRNQNIRFVHRENGGLSAARNTGLREARGKYVWFIDSDDWIEPDCLNFLVHFAEDKDLDVLCFGLQLVYPDGRKAVYNIYHEESDKVYTGEEFICKVKMPSAAWVALYKREYLYDNQLLFMEGILHEDQEFTPRAYSLATSISYVNNVIYNYNQRDGGIMKSNRNKQRAIDLLKVANSLHFFADKHFNQNGEVYKLLSQKAAFAFTQSLAYYNKTYFPLSNYTNSPCYPLSVSPNLKYRELLKYKIANVSIPLYLSIYKMLNKIWK